MSSTRAEGKGFQVEDGASSGRDTTAAGVEGSTSTSSGVDTAPRYTAPRTPGAVLYDTLHRSALILANPLSPPPEHASELGAVVQRLADIERVRPHGPERYFRLDGTGCIQASPVDLAGFRGYTFTAWVSLDGEPPVGTPHGTAGRTRRSAGGAGSRSESSGSSGGGGGAGAAPVGEEATLFSLLTKHGQGVEASLVMDTHASSGEGGGGAVRGRSSKGSSGGGGDGSWGGRGGGYSRVVRALRIRSKLVKGGWFGGKWNHVEKPVCVPSGDGLFHCITIVHSLPYTFMRRSRVAVYVDGEMQFEEDLPYPQLPATHPIPRPCLGQGLQGRLGSATLFQGTCASYTTTYTTPYQWYCQTVYYDLYYDLMYRILLRHEGILTLAY